MNDAVLVEVQGQNGAYYKAYVTDVFEEDEIQLKFDMDWQPESKFPVSRVRLPPPSPALPLEFTVGQEIEVQSVPYTVFNFHIVYHGTSIGLNNPAIQ